ncbi:MAG: RnfH family protein [Gammaproteobacteria bacterium]|nr:RnfH family protein [Gammaproteobacteria bacterium]
MTHTVTVVMAMPECQFVVELMVPTTCSAREALLLAVEQGLDISLAGLDPTTAPLGVYGLEVSDSTVLQDGDRLEVYRPLKQDPKELRRQRAEATRANKNSGATRKRAD